MAKLPSLESVRIGVIGLGYVGLPLAVAFGRKFPTVGFDVKPERIAELREGRDETLEVPPEDLAAAPHLSYADGAFEIEEECLLKELSDAFGLRAQEFQLLDNWVKRLMALEQEARALMD